MTKRRCIFCGKIEADFDENNSWSIEHIIPLSLGNTQLKTSDVCVDCNNKLGQYVDSYFVDNMLISMKRKELGLKGESGKIPNPFKQGIDQFGHKIRVDDSFKVSLVPQLSAETVSEGIHYKGNANSKDEAKNIISKSLKRKGYKPDIIKNVLHQLDNTDTHTYQPIVSYKLEIEPNRIALFILKIAYEYTCLRLGEPYWNDAIAIEIREMLYKAICGEMKDKCETCRWVCTTPDEITNNFSKGTDLKIHMIFLHPDAENKLICEIFLFLDKFTSFSVIVSENANNYQQLPPWDIIEIHTS
ncbi:MAG: HNH endonuclease [Prevotella sp.]|nr:HNH endonuclease [Alistipes senegalensis]MCM1357098.1 HNH endonuclease [Prevotella sp.]MCM1472580.1 HNH endonuclease [Muribaculaceae bacterium]